MGQGVGDDADTLGSALVWVYDSDQYPFQQAELYHQFHDDYIKPAGDYPESYHALSGVLQNSGRLSVSACNKASGGGGAGSTALEQTEEQIEKPLEKSTKDQTKDKDDGDSSS